MKNIVLKNAEEKDIPVILELIKGLADYENMSNDVTNTEEKLLNTLFREKYAEVIIANYNGEPAGFALYFYNYSTFLGKPGIYLEDLYIHKHLRNKGIGSEIFKHLCSIAMEKDCGRVEWSCLDWNEPAKTFYKKIGAVEMDEWTVHRLTEENIKKIAES